jgi:hypothetical protein
MKNVNKSMNLSKELLSNPFIMRDLEKVQESESYMANALKSREKSLYS